MTRIFPTGKKFNILLHVVVWLIMFTLPTYMLYVDSRSDAFLLKRVYFQTFLYALTFYINYLWLVPTYFFRRKKILYVISVLLLVFVMTLASESLNLISPREDRREMQMDAFPPGPPPPDMERTKPTRTMPIFDFVLITFLMSGFGLGLRFSGKLAENEKQRKESEKERLKAELALLKNQINPHFFFNTLNNIYALVNTQPESGQKAILWLSRLMRYLLYETENPTVRLSQEIEFLKNYLELMKLRLTEKVDLKVDLPGEFDDIPVPPLIFLPFLENAFKHGISYRVPSFIHVRMEVKQDEIDFMCINSLVPEQEQKEGTKPGIGLDNVKKRLTLLYPDSHHLHVSPGKDSFAIHLIINVKRSPVYD